MRGTLERIQDACSDLAQAIQRGPEHRSRLEEIDTQIVVSGTRGKSTLVRWTYETLYSRGYDATAKITGNEPVALHNGDVDEIERDGRVTLYENVSELRDHTPDDALVLENQAISPHTTRLIHESFVDPDVVILTNIREDHLGTLGRDRETIARAFVQSIPPGTHVVNGERTPELRRYIDAELRRKGCTVSHVTVPRSEGHIPGIESVYALNQALAAIGEAPLSESELEEYRDDLRVQWTQLPEGLVYNAADVNDVQSTELIRRALARQVDAPIEPFVYLRGDRRGRTVSFLRYLDDLYERHGPHAFELCHVAGDGAGAFERRATFPVRVHDEGDDPAAVLDDLLEAGRPALLMGNTVAEWMRELDAEIQRRAEQTRAGPSTTERDEPSVSVEASD
ncbi:Mur ligase family protein [Natrialbaceae archaeon GCM10025810]